MSSNTIPPAGETPPPGPSKANDSGAKKPRLPFKQMTITPSGALRQRILELCEATKKTPKEILHDLLMAASGAKVNLVIVSPVNGEAAGIALDKVTSTIASAALTFRDLKGAVSRGTAEQQTVVTQAYKEALELWAHAQNLADTTFYSTPTMQAGREAWKTIHVAIEKHEKTESGPDAKAAAASRDLLKRWRPVLLILTRLGFSPEGLHSTPFDDEN
jgi:hypothetical protein